MSLYCTISGFGSDISYLVCDIYKIPSRAWCLLLHSVVPSRNVSDSVSGNSCLLSPGANRCPCEKIHDVNGQVHLLTRPAQHVIIYRREEILRATILHLHNFSKDSYFKNILKLVLEDNIAFNCEITENTQKPA